MELSGNSRTAVPRCDVPVHSTLPCDIEAAPRWAYAKKPLIDSTNRHTEPWGRYTKDGPTVTDALTCSEALDRIRKDGELIEPAYEILPLPCFFGMPLKGDGDREDTRFWNQDGVSETECKGHLADVWDSPSSSIPCACLLSRCKSTTTSLKVGAIDYLVVGTSH